MILELAEYFWRHKRCLVFAQLFPLYEIFNKSYNPKLHMTSCQISSSFAQNKYRWLVNELVLMSFNEEDNKQWHNPLFKWMYDQMPFTNRAR